MTCRRGLDLVPCCRVDLDWRGLHGLCASPPVAGGRPRIRSNQRTTLLVGLELVGVAVAPGPESGRSMKLTGHYEGQRDYCHLEHDALASGLGGEAHGQ
jgi:hypothetical protein